MKGRHIELLAPAGNFIKLKTAFLFGADAVYLGGNAFGLRANAGNFTDEEIVEAVKLADSLGKKVYVTCNIISRDADMPGIKEYASFLESAGVHGAIVADIGTFFEIREAAPHLPVHVSTQANNLNSKTVLFWLKNGATRVNLARELSLEEIKEINRNVLEAMPGLAEADEPYLEAFVHGAMCMAFSGRCMLSDYLAGRSSNRGDCAQPCRWEYYLTEQTRPGEYMPVVESERGTFLFNSKDLCMLEYIPELADAGIGSLKIEGRMKSEFYTATTVRAYRIALDAFENDPESFKKDDALKKSLMDELMSCSHRDYTTGFYFGEKGGQIYSSSSYIRKTDFVAVCEICEKSGGGFKIGTVMKSPFSEGDELELMRPDCSEIIRVTVKGLTNEDGEKIERAHVPMMKSYFSVPFEVPVGSMLRRRK